MYIINEFNNLNGKKVSRLQLQKLLEKAKLLKVFEVSSRITKALKLNKEKSFIISIENPIQTLGLNAPRHNGLEKEALTECGRLKKGYKYIKNIGLVKTVKKPVATKKTTKKAQSTKKPSVKKTKIATQSKKVVKKTAKVKQEVVKVSSSKVKPVTHTFDIPVSKIFTDEKRFQNRNKLNENVLAQIIENYSPDKFDAIVIWHDAKLKKDFVLAGHHRFEAIKRLGKKTIAIKYFNGTEAEAIKYAKVESNANRSLETPQERAKVWREKLENTSPKEKKEIFDEVKKIEGKNANYIINLSFLNPKGLTLQALESLSETPDKQNATIIEKLADWIGEARKQFFGKLNDANETEMFNFLQDKNQSLRIKTKADFLHLITANTGLLFYYGDMLNLARFKNKTEGESVYNQEYKALQTQIETAITNKQSLIDRIKNPENKDFINPKAEDYNAVIKTLETVIEKYNNEIKVYQSKLIDLSRKKGSYTTAGSNQVGLFGLKGTNSKEHNTITFNKRLIRAIKKGYGKDEIFYLGKPKDELKKHIENFEIQIVGSVLTKAMKQSNNHFLNWANFLDLPDFINNPIAIFKSKTTGYVVLTEIKDVENNPVMVALHISKKFERSNIASMYVRNKFNTYKTWIKDGLAIYINEKSELFTKTQDTISVAVKNSQSKDNKNSSKKTNGLNISKKNNVTIVELKKHAKYIKENYTDIPNSKKWDKLFLWLSQFDNYLINQFDNEVVVVNSVHKEIWDLIPSDYFYNSKKDNKNGLNKVSVTSSTSVNKNSLAYKMANKPQKVDYFDIQDKDIKKLLGQIEIKPNESVFVSLTGGEGSMKTRMAFQFMNCFAQNYKVGHASIEEHPESVLYYDKAKQYLNAKALNNIHNPEVKTMTDLHKLIQDNDVIVIDSFTKMKEIEKTFEVDKDLRKKYNGKLFIVIFQQTTNGSMRGGSKSQFDADIVLFTEKFDDYTKNYVYATKNRYNKEAGLKFNIFNKQLVENTPAVKKLSFVVK